MELMNSGLRAEDPELGYPFVPLVNTLHKNSESVKDKDFKQEIREVLKF